MQAYLITNAVNGKKYVGITTVPTKRFQQHLKAAREGSRHALHCAISKYGSDAFIYEIIGSAETWDDLAALEISLIAHHRSFVSDGGYNMTRGGDGAVGYKHRPEVCEARRLARVGFKHTPEALAKISATHKGRPCSAETRAKMSAARVGRKMSEAACANRRGRTLKPEHVETLRAINTGNKYSVGLKRTDAQRAHLSEIKRGKPVHDEAARQKLREARALQAPTFGMLGKAHSDDTKARMSAAKIGKKKSPETIERMRLAARRRVEARKGSSGIPTDGKAGKAERSSRV